MTDLFTYTQNLGFLPRKISTTDGGEFSSGCPACGDGGKGKKSDRFHIWPDKETSGLHRGRYWCRQCGTAGDTIKFLQKFHNMDFKSACLELGVSLPNLQAAGRKKFQPTAELPQERGQWSPRTYPEPGATWQEKAGNLLDKCQELIIDHDDAITWLAKRGITLSMISTYRLGYNLSSKNGDRYRPRSSWGLPEKKGRKGTNSKLWIPQGWVIPAFNQCGQLIQLRIRRTDTDIKKFGSNIKYLPLDGSSMATMVLHPEAEVFVPVECGFDAILIAGIMEGKVGTVTTWNVTARPDARSHSILSKSALILNGLDYDKSGENEQAWWNDTYKNNRRLPQPVAGVGDPGEAFEAGVDIRGWIIDSLPRGLQIKLGFTRKKRQVAKEDPLEEPVKPQRIDKPESTRPVVVEIELTNGTLIYVTDDQEEWQALTDQQKPVFSRNELERLKTATVGMSDAERIEAAMQAIEVKEIFGGYISKGENYGR